jgi:hypothetical protein
MLTQADDTTRVIREGVSISRADYLITQFRVIMTYIRLIFVPTNQTVDYDYPLYHSFFEPQVMLSFATIMLLIAIAILIILKTGKTGITRESESRIVRLCAFGIIWFFVTLSVESGLIPIVHVIFEHRIYLPSVGIIVGISSLIHFLAVRRPRVKRFLTVFLIILFSALLLTTHNRNTVWSSEISLWEDGVRKAPLRIAPYVHLGSAYHRAGRYRDAIAMFRLASKLGPDYPEIFFKMGQSYQNLGWMPDAVDAYGTALRIRFNYPEAHNNLGTIYLKKGMLDEAINEYKIALLQNPDFREARYNLAVAEEKIRAGGR